MHTLIRTSWFVLLLFVSTGCATTGTLATPSAAAPASWQATAQNVVAGTAGDLSEWWRQLGDDTLTDLITRALKGSPDVRTAQARLRQARAERGIAGSALLPAVDLSATASDRTGGTSSTGSRSLSAGFDASWEPDIFGGTRASVAAATADVGAATEDLYATQVSLTSEVARNYVELRALQARLAIAQQNEASQAETLQLAEFRAQAGLVSSTDVEQARANLEQTRAQIPGVEESISQAMHRLATLAGLQPAALTGELQQAAALPSLPAAVAAGIPADTLRQRPDVRGAEQRVIAATARVAQADAQRYPQFALSGSIGTEILSGALSGGTSFVASAAGSVLKTIFDGGRLRQQVVVQSAAQEQAVATYESTVLNALEEVENALVSLESSRRRLEALNAAATAATNAAQLARAQYQAGLTDFQRVLDTERTALSVQDSVATTQGERLIAAIQLYKSLGGGWSPAASGSNTGSNAS